MAVAGIEPVFGRLFCRSHPEQLAQNGAIRDAGVYSSAKAGSTASVQRVSAFCLHLFLKLNEFANDTD
jgi:hypothetical protein